MHEQQRVRQLIHIVKQKIKQTINQSIKQTNSLKNTKDLMYHNSHIWI